MSGYREHKCQECGKGTVKLLSVPGRQDWYKHVLLPVPAQLAIPTCDNCGAIWMDGITAKSYDATMEQVYREEMHRRAVEALDKLHPYIQQRDLEFLLGLSHGYLSKVRQGARGASHELVSELVLLAKD